jgi:hypothetical protein
MSTMPGPGLRNQAGLRPAATGPFCSTCGVRNDGDATFCDSCGAALVH